MMTRIGILGGTFDPPHIGHLLMAEFAADALGIDRVLFVPAANPPHKPGTVRVSAAHRLAMVSLAVGSNPLFALSLIDIDRPGPHYTVDLLGILCDQYPDAELYFILGSDSLRSLPQWRHPDELIRRARLAVVERPGGARRCEGV